MDSFKVNVLFLPVVEVPGYQRFFVTYDAPERYGIQVKPLTVQTDKKGFGFSVRTCGKRYRGHFSTQGDPIVRLARQKVKVCP